MRTWKVLLLCALLGSGGLAALSVTWGQETSPSSPVKPASLTVPSVLTPISRDATPRGFEKLSPLQQQMVLSLQRGADWLRRANRSDGRFIAGYVPALRTPLEGDHYLRQAGAAFALARAAGFLGDERMAAVARQAVLTLLLDTAAEAADPQIRHNSLPSVVVNRLASAGLLVLAINELPSPGEDLLEQSEQLCAFIRKQQAQDGSLSTVDSPGQSEADPEAINYYPGEALYGLMRSQRYRPATWKTDVVRRALDFYRTWWRGHQSMALIPWQTAAYTEAYLLTSEKPFVELVTEMADWLCDKQYQQLDPRHPLWSGGFMEWSDGKPVASAPYVNTAYFAEGLAEACRLARRAGDTARYQHYREALERALQFLATLQYTDGNTQHYADWYRPALLGAFHASHQDGNVRIDYTQHAVSALVQYQQVSGDG